MIVVSTVEEMQALSADHKRGAVFTMGALHEGHAQLMRECRKLIGSDGQLVVSIFVNPTQFTEADDLSNYPRTLESDLALCESENVDVVFAPSVTEMYPPGLELPQFSAGALGSVLEGASRPGHFDAVATVVHRLLAITQPHVTCFGEKDFQQLAVVRAMVQAANLDVEVVGVQTKRAEDGLALSSRNVRLSETDRKSARAIPEALELAQRLALNGASVSSVEQQTCEFLERVAGVDIDYCEIRSNDLISDIQAGEGRILIALHIGGVRLIDNAPIFIKDSNP
jgi:pantoate--beta-alanine ligase